MIKALLIVFIKNMKLGTVKTRLASSIGKKGALEIYHELVKITENVVNTLDVDTRIYYSKEIASEGFQNCIKTVQEGKDLGARMKNAFYDGFLRGYNQIILIGSDLPDISSSLINTAFKELESKDAVFGPALDGGYYLIGLSKMHEIIFVNKPWSQPTLLKETLDELSYENISFSTLETLNDIDTFEDLEASNFYKSNLELQQKIKQLND